VQPDEPRRSASAGRDRFERDARRVGRDERRGLRLFSMAANSERWPRPFSKIASMITSARATPSPATSGNQPVEGIATTARVLEPLREELPGPLHRRPEALRVLVLQRHGEAAQRAPRGDVAAIVPGRPRARARPWRPFLAEALRRSCRRNTRIRFSAVGVRIRRGDDAGEEAAPQARCRRTSANSSRIAYAPDSARGARASPTCFAACAAIGATRDRVSVSDNGSFSVRGAGSARSTPRTVFSMIRAGTASSTSPAPCLPCIDRLAGEQEVERRRCADEPRQSLDPAPAGNDAEHHLGQARRVAGSSTATR